MAILLWLRTKRHVDTLAPEIDDLRLTLIPYCSGQSYEWLEPFVSGDHVLFGLRTNANIHTMKAFVAPEMKRDFIVDWSMTEVGTGLGPFDAHIGTKEDGSNYFDDRFVDPEGDNVDALTKAADELGFARLDWGVPYDVNGATGLWISLVREREDRDPLVFQIERSLPKPVQRMWQGRTAMLFAYNSNHDLRHPSPYGFTEELMGLLEKHDVDWFLAFQIGNASVGGAIENFNAMNDWIWKRRPKGSKRSAPSKPKVVVLRSTR